MSTCYDIIAARGVAIIRHSGFVTLEDSQASFAEFQKDPDMRPGQNHIVDCATVTGYEQDFVRFMAFQAELLGQFGPTIPEFLLVLIAPPGVPRDLAVLIRNTWADSKTVLPRIVETEAEALELLGLPERSLSALMANA